jgi:hypothetical protein
VDRQPLPSAATRQRSAPGANGHDGPPGRPSAQSPQTSRYARSGRVRMCRTAARFRSAGGMTDHLQDRADELVGLNVNVIVTAATVATGTARRATDTIPIVMGDSADPVGNGFVKSLARPGGNITGLSTLRTDTTVPACSRLCRQDSQRGATGRPSRRTAGEIRVRHQSQDSRRLE